MYEIIWDLSVQKKFNFKIIIDEDFGSYDVVLMINKGHQKPVGF